MIYIYILIQWRQWEGLGIILRRIVEIQMFFSDDHETIKRIFFPGVIRVLKLITPVGLYICNETYKIDRGFEQ